MASVTACGLTSMTIAGLLSFAAALRLRVDDNGEPARLDTFRVRIGAYDSGTVDVTSGNLQSHPTQTP